MDDGAQFCPLDESNAVDLMHATTSGMVPASLSPKDTTLGELLHAPADQYNMGKLLYTYDLGDLWHHLITLESVIPPSESTGRYVWGSETHVNSSNR